MKTEKVEQGGGSVRRNKEKSSWHQELCVWVPVL